mmetsp:Transcript_135936/g.378875  ORF Transcript_135936/g.378875 Transcript_135936/m.378875 type:complete len:428 (-) Transcript_135936:164-1447(-)
MHEEAPTATCACPAAGAPALVSAGTQHQAMQGELLRVQLARCKSERSEGLFVAGATGRRNGPRLRHRRGGSGVLDGGGLRRSSFVGVEGAVADGADDAVPGQGHSGRVVDGRLGAELRQRHGLEGVALAARPEERCMAVPERSCEDARAEQEDGTARTVLAASLLSVLDAELVIEGLQGRLKGPPYAALAPEAPVLAQLPQQLRVQVLRVELRAVGARAALEDGKQRGRPVEMLERRPQSLAGRHQVADDDAPPRLRARRSRRRGLGAEREARLVRRHVERVGLYVLLQVLRPNEVLPVAFGIEEPTGLMPPPALRGVPDPLRPRLAGAVKALEDKGVISVRLIAAPWLLVLLCVQLWRPFFSPSQLNPPCVNFSAPCSLAHYLQQGLLLWHLLCAFFLLLQLLTLTVLKNLPVWNGHTRLYFAGHA